MLGNQFLNYMTPLAPKSHSAIAPAARIKRLAARAGIVWSDVARREGVSESSLCRTIHGLRRSVRMRQIVADALGMNHQDLFGKDCRAGAAAINWSAVARRYGVSQSSLSSTVNGHNTSRRMRAIVAYELSVPFDRLWPSNGGRR